MNYRVFFKRIFLVIILVCMSFVATACDFDYTYEQTPPAITVPEDNFPEIPVFEQNKNLTEEQILGSDFFSSKKDYLNVGDYNRYVNLKDHKTVYIRYEKNLDKDVKKELDAVVKYLRNTLKAFNSSYKIVYDVGTPGFFDVFCYDTVYVKNPDEYVLNRFEGSNTVGLALFGKSQSPVVYADKSVCNVIINGKNIKLAQILLHEVMHGFGFGHTEGKSDTMSPYLAYIKEDEGQYFYYENGNEYPTYKNDYLFFSNDEKAALVEYLAPKKSYAEKLKLYKKIGGTLPDLDSKFEYMKKQFVWNIGLESSTNNSADVLLENQIVSMKDRTNTYEIILNDIGIGSYTVKLSNGTSFRGKCKITSAYRNYIDYQIIMLTDFVHNGKVQDITLYSIRKQHKKFDQRWKVSDKKINLVFADNTANYFKQK